VARTLQVRGTHALETLGLKKAIRSLTHIAFRLKVTTHPEAAAKRKMQRNFSKKEGRKRKDTLFA
jgi:hypothetical protein